MSSSDEVPDLGLPARPEIEATGADPMLEALVGRPREESRARDVGADAVKLVNLVDSAVVNSTPTAIYVDAPKNTKLKKPRGHRRIDWINVVAASTAVVVLAATAVFTGVQVASADPASDAVGILNSDEEALTGAENAVMSSITRVEESIATGRADSALIRTALGELTATVDREATADPAALAAAVQAVDAYQAALDAVAIPAAPKPYKRGSVDERSLASVGEAINRVQEASTTLEGASDDLRTVRTAVDALSTTYTGQLAAFATTLTTYAATENEAHPVAGQEFRDAVTAAATAVTATPLTGASGAAALTSFRDAVLALRAEDLRVREEEERERESEQSNNNGQPDYSEPEPAPQDPQPVDPAPVTPGDPAPVDPAPTDPGETEPGDGGGLFP